MTDDCTAPPKDVGTAWGAEPGGQTTGVAPPQPESLSYSQVTLLQLP